MKKVLLGICILILSAGMVYSQTAVVPEGSGTENNPYRIASLENLYWMSQNSSCWDKVFIQTADIDAADTRNWPGTGWIPIGNEGSFSGTYNGNNHQVTGLYYNFSGSTPASGGLFTYLNNAKVINLTVTEASFYFSGEYTVGGIIAGSIDQSEITNCQLSGSIGIAMAAKVGGLSSQISNSKVVNVTASIDLSGHTIGTGCFARVIASSNISNCTAFGNILCPSHIIGGFSWSADNSEIDRCFFQGVVGQPNQSYQPCGFIGYINHSNITNCYVIADLFGYDPVGFIAEIRTNSKIQNSYSASTIVPAEFGVGWFFGFLIENGSTISNCFWDMDVSGTNNGEGGTGLTSEEMKSADTFINAGWDFIGEISNGTEDIWSMDQEGIYNSGYPYLAWQDGWISDIQRPTVDPQTFILHPAYPNPFNPSTTLRYELPVYGLVKLTVYDINGCAVCELVNTVQPAGEYSVVWNGRDRQNRQLSSGIYIAWLETEAYVHSCKMLLLK